MSPANHPPVWAIVPAAGIGQRMGGERPKQYLEVGERTILEQTLERLATSPAIRAVLPVIRADDGHWPAIRERLGHLPNLLPTAQGGAERSDSVASGLEALGEIDDNDRVLVHDAVRPCIRDGDIQAVIGATTAEQGAILAVPVADTLKRVAEDGRIQATVDRSELWRAQTPQVFPAGALRRGIEAARSEGRAATDEASLLEPLGFPVTVVAGREENIKVTKPEDLDWVARFLEAS